MTSPKRPPEDIRTPGTPIKPAPIPADERDAIQPESAARGEAESTETGFPQAALPEGMAASESAPSIPPDTRVQESAPVIPTDLDEDQGVAATLPRGAAPRESAPVVPSGKPGQERAPVIQTDTQEQQAAQEAEDHPSPSTSEATKDSPLSREDTMA